MEKESILPAEKEMMEDKGEEEEESDGESDEEDHVAPREYLDNLSSNKTPVVVLMKRSRQEIHGILQAYDDSFNLVISNATSYFLNEDGTDHKVQNKKILVNGATVTCVIPSEHGPDHEEHKPFFSQ